MGCCTGLSTVPGTKSHEMVATINVYINIIIIVISISRGSCALGLSRGTG